MLPEYIRLDATAYIMHEESGMEVAMKLGSLGKPDRLFNKEGLDDFLTSAISAAENFTGNKGGWRPMTKAEIDAYIRRDDNGEDHYEDHGPDCGCDDEIDDEDIDDEDIIDLDNFEDTE